MRLETRNMLIVEDDIIVAMDAEASVAEAGYTPISVASVEAAEQVLEKLDVIAAILDFEVVGGNTAGIARELTLRSIPFSVVSGTTAHGLINAGINPDIVVNKPADYNAVIRRLTAESAPATTA